MGQQQLLLLVLGIVIVGLAVVVGIQAFGENQKKANADALTNDVIRIASDAQAWALKPAAFGGGNGKFDGVDLTKLSYQVDANGVYNNLNGEYRMAVTTDGTAITTGTIKITGCDAKTLNQIASTVTGTGPGNITTNATTVTACPTADPT